MDWFGKIIGYDGITSKEEKDAFRKGFWDAWRHLGPPTLLLIVAMSFYIYVFLVK